MGESNTIVSAYTSYRHLQQYCSYPSICTVDMALSLIPKRELHCQENRTGNIETDEEIARKFCVYHNYFS